MRDILIINLKRNGDIFTTGHIIRSLITKYPEIKISMLVLEEFKKASEAMKGIEKVYTIDRKKILTYTKNKIFSDGFALDQFSKDLSEIRSKNWDAVFNYSNDRVSTHITSLLKSKSLKHFGIRFNDTCNVEYSNEWAIVFNDLVPSVKYSPVTFIDAYMHMANLTPNRESYVLRTKQDYNEACAKNFSEIRKIESTGNDIKLVGIQLFSSSAYKNLDREQLVSLIDALYMNTNFFPILLVAPIDEEREFAASINADFNNSLVSVEADFVALNSVIMNLDLLITCDTAIKHVADLSSIPTIEISLGEAPLFKQGTINPESYIITPSVNSREFSKKAVDQSENLQTQHMLINTNDIMALVNNILLAETLNGYHFNKGVSVYRVNQDELGMYHVLAHGEVDTIVETERLMSRQYLIKKFTKTEDVSYYRDLQAMNISDVEAWSTKIKEDITETSKTLLGTLRSLLQLDNSKAKLKSFVQNLTSLISICESESQFTALPVLRFRARIEALNSSNIESSAREVEALLYELKANIQVQVEIIKSVSDYVRTAKDQTRLRSSQGILNVNQ